jgi:uncharacterized protein YgbK (DUF1537 family)
MSKSLQESNRATLLNSGRVVIVLDDDPTGTQTVHDLPVLTSWMDGEIAAELERGTPVFYVLTNSRSVGPERASEINREIVAALPAHAECLLVSRSDSTLRGHFPLETDTLADALDIDWPVLVIPFFEEGGRLTIEDVHYVKEGDELIPAAETPFARDAVFGFKHSNLREWVEEKTEGAILAREVESIPAGDPESVLAALSRVKRAGIVNASTMDDMEVLVDALHQCGRRFLFRTAGSFVRALAGLPKQPLLDRSAVLDPNGCGGLVVVGSYVPKSTAQLAALMKSEDIDVFPVELDASELNVATTLAKVENALRANHVVALYTSRDLITGSSSEESLAIGRRISHALVEIVAGLQTSPRFLIAKGGITSSDIATNALQIRRAIVVGQLIPGVPVWRTEKGLGYVVFPGNVGDDGALLEAVTKLIA